MRQTSEGFSLNFPPFTRAVKLLLYANLGTYLFFLIVGVISPAAVQFLANALGLLPVAVVHGRLWQLVTYAFLHAGFWHIFLNMLFLWMFGAMLEGAWGWRKFLEFYAFSVVGAAIITVWFSYARTFGLSPTQLTVGASGGIYGILMACAMLYGDQKIRLFPFFFISFKLKYMVWALALLQVWGLFHPDGVSHIGHLGGMLCGFLYIRFLGKKLLSGSLLGWIDSRKATYRRWQKKRRMKKFTVYMRERGDVSPFDEHGNYLPPNERKGPEDDT